MFKGLSIRTAFHQFWENMKNIEYVEAHWQYHLAWGTIIFLKELIIWSTIMILAYLVNAELLALQVM